MSQVFNTASVTSTNSEKLFISTDTNDADKLELQALKALVRDNIRDGNGTLLPIGTIDGTGTDLSYDFHTKNMINQDIFSSQIHIVHTTYEQRANDQDASFLDVSCGTVDLSQIEIDETTAAFVEGTLILDICNGADDISLNDGAGNNKHNLQFTSASSIDRSFTKALLSASDNSDSSLLFSVIEDASNVSTIILNKQPTGVVGIGANTKLDVFLDNSNAVALSAYPSQVLYGTYRATLNTDGQVTTIIKPDQTGVGLRDLSGSEPLASYSGDNQLANLIDPSNVVSSYQLIISITDAGNITIANETFDISNIDSMVNNLDYMNAIRDYGSNKNVVDGGRLQDSSATYLAHTDVSSHSIKITNSIIDLSFGGVNNTSFENGTGGSFKTFLNDSQDEFLTAGQFRGGVITLAKYDISERIEIVNNNDVSDVLLGSTVAYIGDAAIQSTTVDACLNQTEIVTYTVKQKFPNPGSALLDGLCVSGGNQTYALAIKDESSTLFLDASINAVFVPDEVATLQSVGNDLTFIKVTDNNLFTTRVNKIFDLCNTDLSYGNPDVQIEITGTNVQLDKLGSYNFDLVRLFLETKTLTDLANSGTGLVADADNFLSFSTTDAGLQLKTKVDYSNKLNEFVWDVIDNGSSRDISFSIVPNIVGDVPAHKFQSKIQTLVKKEWRVGDTIKEIVDYPDEYTLTEVGSPSLAIQEVSDHGGGKVKQYTKTTTNTITHPFPLGSYQNIQTVMSGIQIVDVYYEWFHSDGTKGPESKLRDYNAFTASRTITYTPQKRTITKSMIHTMKGQLQGRNKTTGVYDTTEAKYDIDFGFNLFTTIPGFNTNSSANFVINMDLDEGDVSLNSAQYEILLDFAEGNSVWTITKKASYLIDMTNGLTSLQDIFDASDFETDSNLSSNHIVDDITGKNTLTLKNSDVSFVSLEADRTLLANFIIVIANGPVLNVLRNGADISFDNYLYTTDDKLLIDNGIQLDICENIVNFGGVDMSLNLRKDKVNVSHYLGAGVTGDIVTSKTYASDIAQDVSFNNYRGIIENQTIEIRRVPGHFYLDFSGVSQSANAHFSAGTVLDASMGDFSDISMGDLGYDIVSNKSYLGTPISSVPIVLTPAKYSVTGTVADGNIADFGTKTSFSDVIFDFYQAHSDTNPNSNGLFKASKFDRLVDTIYDVKSADAGELNIYNPNGTQIGNMRGELIGDADYFDLSFDNVKYPFVIRLKDDIQQNTDVYFSLAPPKYKVQYRNPTGVDHFPFTGDATDNTTTQYLSTVTATHTLSDIAATITLDISKTFIDFALNRSTTEFKTDMSGNSNTIRAQVIYDAGINPGISNEYLVIPNSETDTSSVAVSIDKITKTGNFYQLAMTQQANGLYTASGYDVCSNLINSVSNILVNLPGAYMNEGRYQSVITPNIGVKTSLIGAEYDLSGTIPVIKIRKYTSPIHESFETFKIDQNNIRAVGFRASTIQEATIVLDNIAFGTTAYSFQSILNSTATALSGLPAYTTVVKNDISGEDIWDDYATGRLKYVMVPLTYSGIGNILEVTSASSIKPVKTLVASTPDITRITSGDGAPIFRVRANGRIDTGTVQTSNLISVTSQTNNSGQTYNNEFVSYNVLLG
jgi:hypothetical protein